MKITNIIKNEKGSTIVLVTVMMTALIAMMGVVADVGYAFLEKQEIQNAVDAAALAGAQELPDISKASAKASELAQQNNLEQSAIQISFEDSNRKIVVESTKNIKFSFVSVLNIFNSHVGARAAAVISSGGIFDYTLFSGSSNTDLKLNGNNILVDGSVHTNDDLKVNGNCIRVTGISKAVKKIRVNGCRIYIPHREPYSSYVDMLDYTDEVKAQAEEAGQVFNSSKNYNGNNVHVDNSIYVKGSVHLNGNSIVGVGALLAEDDIHINGNLITQGSDDAICLYSERDIKVNGNSIVINGILYAPNGEISLNGNNIRINGKVIGKTVKINGNAISIIDDISASQIFATSIKLVE